MRTYSAICPNAIGKVLERMMYNWLYLIIDSSGSLSNRQFDFRKAFEGKYYPLVILDIKKGFSSARLNFIIEALIAAQTPNYIYINYNLRLIRTAEVIILYDSDEESKTFDITTGVPKGSILVPLIWNIMYDDRLLSWDSQMALGWS